VKKIDGQTTRLEAEPGGVPLRATKQRNKLAEDSGLAWEAPLYAGISCLCSAYRPTFALPICMNLVRGDISILKYWRNEAK
jgi:hypothetical protein